jgi:Dolichyl-phosphate-mannose-protein mannosyltransferase
VKSRVSSFAIALAVIALVAIAVRVTFVVVVDPEVPRIGDASAYHLLANNLADHGEYFRPFDDQLLDRVRPTAEYPPLFPVLLAVPARFGAESVESQRLFLCFVGAATVVLVGLLGRRLGGPAVGLVAAGIAAVYPMLFQSEAILMAEALYALLVTVVLLLAYRAIDQPTSARFALLGVGIGLATLTRAEGLLLGAVLVVPLCWCLFALEPKRRAILAATALGVAVLVVVPWTIRNAVRLDAFVPVSNNVSTLIDGANCDAVYGGDQLGLWRETFSQFGDDARQKPQAVACFEGFDIGSPDFEEAEVADRHRDDGIEYARDHLGSSPKVMAVRWLRTFGLYDPSQQVDYESLEGRPRNWQMAGTVMFWVLMPFAVGGVVLLRRKRVPIWPLVSTVVVVSITAMLTYGQQRFRVAAEPAIIATAAVALVAIGRAVRPTRQPALPAQSQPAR